MDQPSLHQRECSHSHIRPCRQCDGTGLPRILRTKHFVQLLQCTTFRFHKEEVDEGKLEDVPEYEEHIEPISDIPAIHIST
jgi:hypothetical protein